MDSKNTDHKILAEFFIEGLHDDPGIEFKAKIDQYYDRDPVLQALVKKTISFFQELTFPDNIDLEVQLFRAHNAYPFWIKQ